MSWPAGTVDFILAFRPHSDLLARMSTVSAGRNSRLCSSISASFRFTRQNVYSIGQAGLLDGRFARPASKPAGEQTSQNISFFVYTSAYILHPTVHLATLSSGHSYPGALHLPSRTGSPRKLHPKIKSQAQITFYGIEIIKWNWYEKRSNTLCDHEFLVKLINWPLYKAMYINVWAGNRAYV